MIGSKVTDTIEKRVISSNASAGTYWFRDPSYFIKCCIDINNQKKNYSVKDSLFICPTYNKLIEDGYTVVGEKVSFKLCLSTKIKDGY